MLKGTLPCAPDQVYRLVQSFRGVFADQATNVVDGLRVSWSDGWLHVRASNTEPLLRIIVEANTEARAKALFEQAMAHARSLLGGA
jgi:phosphomannomutase